MQENELMFEITITKSGNPELKGNISSFTLTASEEKQKIIFKSNLFKQNFSILWAN